MLFTMHKITLMIIAASLLTILRYVHSLSVQIYLANYTLYSALYTIPNLWLWPILIGIQYVYWLFLFLKAWT